MRRFALVVLGLLALVACGSPPITIPPRPAPGLVSDTFARGEDEILRDLAAIDRRLAQRLQIRASEEDLRRVALAAVLREDLTLAIAFGAIDPFSFDARARGLQAAKGKLASLTPDKATPSERSLLGRLIDGEVERLAEEERLPRSASRLVRAIVETWQPPSDERELAETDKWLARRLGAVGKAIGKPPDPDDDLDVVRARELDDTLDALERLTANPGFKQTTQELVRVREALEAKASRPAAKAHSDWDTIAARFRVHLASTNVDDLGPGLAAAEADLRPRAEQAIARASFDREALAAAIEKSMFLTTPCVDRIPTSRVRSIEAPLEREPACHLRHQVADAGDDKARAIALAAMHDHVVVAQWALDVARGTATIAETEGKHHPIAPISLTARARYERVALARPVAAIGAGEAARILIAGDPVSRARAWSGFGDAPFDVVIAALGSKPPAR